ncbi:NfeD family protein [Waterburya agarophytonicola K14]|uniref:NfeD family protein n=1 Tax=Waterburya agarophytonicola KI4 TaxID=2874699 RepID=A0A964BTS4_9CYAN|nr:NfeD family protein [Waterburya agarophytonicola]MCC0179674.1 NfeD family protein [Waterburya agarophytonicola KI4]
MNYLILTIAGISIAIGVFLGALIVWFIYFWRRREVIDSLMKPEDLVGLCGIVELPFDENSKGKVRVDVRGSMVDLIALTDDKQEFQVGDRILIIQMQNNKVWVTRHES